MSVARRILVVGGGVFGFCAARELRRRGAKVTLLDSAPWPHPDASSTDISKIVRLDYGEDELYTALMEECLVTWFDWNQRWGKQLYHPTGVLFLSRAPLVDEGFEASSIETLERRGHRVERLDASSIRERYPMWRSGGYVDGYFNPQGGWAESGLIVSRLAAEARDEGVELMVGRRVVRLSDGDAGVRGVWLEDGEELGADEVVLATGAWTAALLPELRPCLRSVGQPVIHLAPEASGGFRGETFPPWASDIGTTGWYGFPASSSGVVKVANHGPGRPIPANAPRSIQPQDQRALRVFLDQSCPTLADAPIVSSRLCLYCDTVDGDFWIARHPIRQGLVVASGGSGHGFKFAPVLGALVADVLEGRTNRTSQRFGWRTRAEAGRESARRGND